MASHLGQIGGCALATADNVLYILHIILGPVKNLQENAIAAGSEEGSIDRLGDGFTSQNVVCMCCKLARNVTQCQVTQALASSGIKWQKAKVKLWEVIQSRLTGL